MILIVDSPIAPLQKTVKISKNCATLTFSEVEKIWNGPSINFAVFGPQVVKEWVHQPSQWFETLVRVVREHLFQEIY